VKAIGEVEISEAPEPPGLNKANTLAFPVVMEYFKGVQPPTEAVKCTNSLFLAVSW
jgi:hypothetical protein